VVLLPIQVTIMLMLENNRGLQALFHHGIPGLRLEHRIDPSDSRWLNGCFELAPLLLLYEFAIE
jgi:hypothetical protein